jgi:hypothetical protein
MNMKVNKKVVIVWALLVIVAAVVVYHFFFQKPCSCSIIGGGPEWSGKSPCPPTGISVDSCPYPSAP